MSYTTDPNDPRLGHGVDDKPVKQHDTYLILSDEERAKGFIRPVRQSYVHVGKKVELDGTLEELSKEEKERSGMGYFAFIRYTPGAGSAIGRYIRQPEYDAIKTGETHIGGCGTRTTMALPLAETYSRAPGFYGSTYCCGCQKHLPVDEFVWDGTNELVGS